MTARPHGSDDALLRVATLAFTLVRFAEGAAHPPRGTPQGAPRLGEDVWMFAPSTRRVPREEVPMFLAEQSSPALLFPTTTRGIVTLLLLDELSGERATGARKAFANQRTGLDEIAGRLGLTADSPILLESDDGVQIVPLSVLRHWSERFLVDVGWNLGWLEDDPRASVRLNLFRSDGIHTPGAPGPARPSGSTA